MDPLNLPEDLSSLSPEELADVGEKIAERVTELADVTDITDDVISEIEHLAEAADRIDGEAARREEESAARRSRLDNALARFGDDEGENAEEGDEAAEVETVAADETATAPEVIEGELVEEEPPAEAIAASSNRRPSSGSLARLGGRRPAAQTPAPSAASRQAFMFASAHALVPESTELDGPARVADAIVRKRYSSSFANVPAGVQGELVPIAQGLKGGLDTELTADERVNYGLLRETQSSHQSLVASGQCCTPQTPLYDFFRLAEPQDPVESALPVVQAPRGGIRYITGNCDFSPALAAIGEECCGDNDDPDNPVQKPCTHVDCPTVEEETVCAVSHCVTFGNLQYRTFQEQVEDFLADTAVAFQLRKELHYMDRIDADSVAVTSAIPYGASRGLLFDWVTAAVAYRKRNHMSRTATLELFAPDWAMDLIKLDMAMDHDNGLSHFMVTDAMVVDALRARNIDVTWYYDGATGSDQFAGAQGAGALNPWPTEVISYLFSPGTFVRLDGGTLDVGLVRDSVLNRTNDLQLFMEEWIGFAMLGCESIKLTSTVCPNGTGPEAVTPVSC